MSITLDTTVFEQRAKALIGCLRESSTVDSFLFTVGAASVDEIAYQKSTCLQTWLLGYEFPDTFIAIIPKENKITFLTSAKKASILRTLAPVTLQIDVMERSKDPAQSKVTLNAFLSVIRESGQSTGILSKDRFEGKFIQEWKQILAASPALQTVDVATCVSAVMALKDEAEAKNVQAASNLSNTIMTGFFIPEMQSIIDEGKKVTHEALSAKIESCLTDDRLKAKLGLRDTDYVDLCYPPIIQSGGSFDLKPSATSNNQPLHEGTIICSLGTRYKSYCSTITRTFLMNPDKEQETNYSFLLELQKIALAHMKDGVECRSVYLAVLNHVEKNRPDLVMNLVKNIGFSIGLEFRESMFLLSAKNTQTMRAGMLFNLNVGLAGIKRPSGKSPRDKEYALQLGDMVKISAAGDAPALLTNAEKDLTSISYEMGDDEEDEESAGSIRGNVDRKTKEVLAGASAMAKKNEVKREERESAEAKRRAHQHQLATAKQKEGLARFAKGTETAKNLLEQKTFKKFESYRKEGMLPKTDLRIIVDRRNESIILPMYGMCVPFHISTLKNVTKSDESDSVMLRFNFMTPVAGTGVKAAASMTVFENEEATFIKTLVFRSADIHRFNELFKEINDMKKEMVKREAERKELSDLVHQDSLIEIKGRRPPRLADVQIRPTLEGKKVPGDLDIHTNGLRYQSALRSDQRQDILFSNIKHLFFQPCDSELLVILHIHLHNPIMLGKKKTKDIQFYREVSEGGFEETGRNARRRMSNYGDEDELQAEMEERRRRLELNREFQNFSEKISEMSKGVCDVDVPERSLGFHGVPFRQLVLLQPTTDCLVNLTDMPFFVATLADVEIAHLERVQFGLKNFDLVLVFKDYRRAPVHINSIPIKMLENVKDWLDSCDIAFSEGPANLSWPQIMKTVNEDPLHFFEDGGWSFLTGDGGSDDESESASEFEVSSAASEESSESSDSYSGSDDYSDESGSGSDAGGSDDESGNETGEDWDEMEERTAREEAARKARRGFNDEGDDDDDNKPRKKSKLKGKY